MDSFKPNDYYWTDHVRQKMRQYRLSESRVKRVLRFPRRREVGVAENTIAGMQPCGTAKKPREIWVMWTIKKLKSQNSKIFIKGGSTSGGKIEIQNSRLSKHKKQQIVIISAWIYPGVSPRREPPPIPDDVWETLRKYKTQN